MACHWREGMCADCQYRGTRRLAGLAQMALATRRAFISVWHYARKATRQCFTTTTWPDAMNSIRVVGTGASSVGPRASQTRSSADRVPLSGGRSAVRPRRPLASNGVHAGPSSLCRDCLARCKHGAFEAYSRGRLVSAVRESTTGNLKR